MIKINFQKIRIITLISIQIMLPFLANIDPREETHTGVAYKSDESFKADFLNSISRDIQNLNGSVSGKINLNCDLKMLYQNSHILLQTGQTYFLKSHIN